MRNAWRFGWMVVLGSAGVACSVELRHDLSEDAANEIIVVLDEAGIAAGKKRGEGAKDAEWVVKVPKGDATRAWRVLKENELPRRRDREFGEVFQKGGLVPSAAEERALFLHALSGKLANMLRAVPSVIDARVHVAVDEAKAIGGDAAKPVSASVVVKERVADGARGLETDAVKRLVAAAVPGLRADAVEVVRVTVAHREAARSAMEQVGPFSVSSGSATALLVVLVVTIGLIVSLSGIALWLVMRLRAARVDT
ncbi:MAG: secretion protein [Deltaproteobacteria bacterium]|nr:secretion protein [Deltaproteobacteria bacterium]